MKKELAPIVNLWGIPTSIPTLHFEKGGFKSTTTMVSNYETKTFQLCTWNMGVISLIVTWVHIHGFCGEMS